MLSIIIRQILVLLEHLLSRFAQMISLFAIKNPLPRLLIAAYDQLDKIINQDIALSDQIRCVYEKTHFYLIELIL
jgi:hypothetical protein